MKENLSAMMDGELDDQQIQTCLQEISKDPQLAERWDEYHLIGDLLRGSAVMAVDVRGKVSARLQAEPTVLAPRASARPVAANHVRYAMAASVAMAAVMGWVFWQGQGAAEHVAVPVAMVEQNATAKVVMFSKEERDSYLRAHHELMLGDGVSRVGIESAQGVAH